MNLKLLDYSIKSIFRKKGKNTVLFVGLTFSLWFLSSSLFTAFSIKSMILGNIESMPEITIQKVAGGRLEPIDVELMYEFEQLPGVKEALDRVWGYYYFSHRRLKDEGVNFTLVGLDLYKDEYKESLKKLTYDYFDTLEEGKLLLGKSAYKTINKGYFEDFFDFYDPLGEKVRVEIGAILNELYDFESSGMLILSKEFARKILGIDSAKATDIVLKVPNKDEIETIKSKISQAHKDLRVISRDDIYSAYNGLYDFKSGFFLLIFLSSVFALFLLIYEKSSGTGDDEKREIGTLRAIGWKIEDIIAVKFTEHAILILSSLFCAVIAAYLFVYLFDAPILREIFFSQNELSPPFSLTPGIETIHIMGIVLLVSIIYLSLVLIPIWRSSVIDPIESIK